MVVVPAAPSGRFRNAHEPPVLSARAMTAPPWSTPPDVHSSSAQSSRARTSAGVLARVLMPRVRTNGIEARSRSASVESELIRAV